MHIFKIIRNLIRANYIASHYGLVKIFFSFFGKPKNSVWFLIAINMLLPWNWLPKSKAKPEVRLRLALENLGIIFVKLGQILSSRIDLLPSEFANELAKLQDACPSINFTEIEKVLIAELGADYLKLYNSFNKKALASASIAQVHRAELILNKNNKKKVIVKVVKPNTEKNIAENIILIKFFANLLNYFLGERSTKIKPLELVEEFERVIYNELNMQREAASANLVRYNFEKDSRLYVPEIYWQATSNKVMTMEWIDAIKISNTTKLAKNNINLKLLSENGVNIFFTQVFEHNFFHADMHPGNMLILQDGRFAAVDFGIMGRLSDRDKQFLLINFDGLFNRNYLNIAKAFIDYGWVDANTQVYELEIAIRTICEPIWGRDIADISFAKIIINLFDVAKKFGVAVNPQLLLFEKTLLGVEGLGRRINPNLNLWQTAKPLIDKFVQQQTSLRTIYNKHFKNLDTSIKNNFEQFFAAKQDVYQLISVARKNLVEKEKTSKEQNKKLISRLNILIILFSLILSGEIYLMYIIFR